MPFQCNACGEISCSIIKKRDLVKRSEKDPFFKASMVADPMIMLHVFGPILKRLLEYVLNRKEDGDQLYTYCEACKRLTKFE